MKDDPNLDDYLLKFSELYQQFNYEKGLAARFMRKSHEICEAHFSSKNVFDRVLEVGAGTGEHVKYIRHQYKEYWLTDSNTSMLDRVSQSSSSEEGGKIISQNENATKLSFPDNSFDRLIATHVLEHLPDPYEVLREWVRVIKHGGVLSIVLPCDPGLAWRLGRMLGPRRTFEKAGVDYDYWMAREHINSIYNLVTFIRYYFPHHDECWYPSRLPMADLNLFYIVHVKIGKS